MTEVAFLLSPARVDGQRAKMLLSDRAEFALARAIRADGAELGEVFSFLSGLYFRGKFTYARTFTPESHIKVITTNSGLRSATDVIRAKDIRAFGEVDIAGGDARYLKPLERDARKLAKSLSRDACVVLLGSIATGKYVDLLIEIFGERLQFPADFVGRGDMSRGGLLLRQARSGEQLAYIPVLGAVRRGKRPPKLGPLSP